MERCQESLLNTAVVDQRTPVAALCQPRPLVLSLFLLLSHPTPHEVDVVSVQGRRDLDISTDELYGIRTSLAAPIYLDVLMTSRTTRAGRRKQTPPVVDCMTSNVERTPPKAHPGDDRSGQRAIFRRWKLHLLPPDARYLSPL